MINELLTHLWQSTLFAIAAGLLTVAFQKNRAKVRFWLWLSASLKFFVPFALLMNLGSHVKWTPAAQQMAAQIATPAVSFAVESVAQPFSEALTIPSSATHVSGTHVSGSMDWPLLAFLGVWACGLLAIALIRLRLWRSIRGAVRVSTPLEISTTVEARVAPGLLEPGVVGLLRPILLLPEGITDRLTESQLEAVLAHELCHVRRRDNLFAAIHMTVEAVFWFHPLVWWIGARLLEERERACDEDVLSLGNQPRIYADAILNVCRLYVESPLVCVSGVTGSDIKRRIEAIMTNRGVQTLNRAKKVLLATAGFVAVAGPVVVGVVIGIGHVPAIHAQSPAAIALPAQSAILPLAQIAQTAPVEKAKASDPAGIAVTPLTAPAGQQQNRRLVVMYFDLDSMTADEQSRARQAGVDFLQKSLLPTDMVAVASYTDGKPIVISDFTDNTAALESAIRSVNGANGGNTNSSASGVDGKLYGIGQIAKMLRNFPEKKALVYFSSGVPKSGMENEAQLKATINLAQQSNMVIYPIDARAKSEVLVPYKKWMDEEVRAIIADEERKTQASGPIGGILGGIPAASVPGGRGRGPETSTPPAGISQDEYNQRVAYAVSKFGSATSAMARAYIRYGAPDQIDTPNSGTSQIWRYNYLEDFHGGAAFEFSGNGPLAGRVLYPPPLATYEGRMMPKTVIQTGPLAEALDKEAGITAYHSLNGFSPRHVSLQINTASPVMPPSADRKFAVVSIPLDSLTGPVDIVGQIKMPSGQLAGMLRDGSQASVGTYQATFALQPGSYMLNVLVKEQSTGRLFGETIDFDVK